MGRTDIQNKSNTTHSRVEMCPKNRNILKINLCMELNSTKVFNKDMNKKKTEIISEMTEQTRNKDEQN